MPPQLHDRTALVTGSTHNIGRAIAVALADAGAHVVVAGRDAARGHQVVADIAAGGGRAELVLTELDGSAEASRALAHAAAEAVGRPIDILVNNAAVYPVASTPETSEADFDRVYALNVKAPFFLTAALAPRMAAAGDGAIVNVGSWMSRLGLPVGAMYSSTKGALETLTRSWAAEFGPRGVRVNMVVPGVIAEAPYHPRVQAMMAGTPHGRPGRPEDVAAAVVHLAGDHARFTHGVILPIDGGRTSAAVVAGS